MLIVLISPEKKHPSFSNQILKWEAIILCGVLLLQVYNHYKTVALPFFPRSPKNSDSVFAQNQLCLSQILSEGTVIKPKMVSLVVEYYQEEIQ